MSIIYITIFRCHLQKAMHETPHKHPPTDKGTVLQAIEHILAHGGTFTGGAVQVGIDRLVRTDHHGDQDGQNHFKVISPGLEPFELRKTFRLASTP